MPGYVTLPRRVVQIYTIQCRTVLSGCKVRCRVVPRQRVDKAPHRARVARPFFWYFTNGRRCFMAIFREFWVLQLRYSLLRFSTVWQTFKLQVPDIVPFKRMILLPVYYSISFCCNIQRALNAFSKITTRGLFLHRIIIYSLD